MKKKKYLKQAYLLTMVLITSVILSACGSPSYDSYGGSSGSAYRNEAPMAVQMEASYDYEKTTSTSLGGGDMYAVADAGSIQPMPMPEMPVLDDSAHNSTPSDLALRKLIKNANLSVETEEFDALIAGVEERVKQLGGYMEHFNVSNNSRFWGGADNNRYGSMTIRIPAVNYDFFVKEISLISNVLNRSESVQDVTFQYVDIESQKKVSVTEHERLLELLSRAESIEDIIILEQRLSSVRYQIERMESQLRTYDNLVDYSTIYLSISEVKELTPVAEQTTWEKIGTGFSKSLTNIGEGFQNLFIGIIVAVPYIVLVSIIIIICLVVIKIGIAVVKRRYQKKFGKSSLLSDDVNEKNDSENIANENHENNEDKT